MPQPDFRARFGLHVQTLREQAELSQEELAARSKLSRHYVSELESGKRNPSLEVLIRLSKGLKIDLKELVAFS